MLFYDNAEDRIETLKAGGMNEEAERLQAQRNEAVGMDVDEDWKIVSMVFFVHVDLVHSS